MALSLVCKDCNAQLRSVAEATSHNEATGHANFEESTESVSLSYAPGNLRSGQQKLFRMQNTMKRSLQAEVVNFLGFDQVLNLVCSTCGKPCRSTTEQELHTKRTGHDSFKDKVNPHAFVGTDET